MKAFICVYRHVQPKGERKKVEKNAEKDFLLRKFLEEYDKSSNFYDWGDDPAFFAVKEIFGDEKFATWGVCRRNVRKQLEKGDLVIFFCTREVEKTWNYYYTGFGTVRKLLCDRELIWKDECYKNYRKFYNLLINDKNQHCEPFGSEHEDSDKRLTAPYIFFETEEGLTHFNLINPLKVATCVPRISLIETWYSHEPMVKELEECLFEKYFTNDRRLRTNHVQHAHNHISLRNIEEDKLNELRRELSDISEKIRLIK